jgi:hypothetical protein
VASWLFTLNHVDEGLLWWEFDPLLRRLKLGQGISIKEFPAGVYTAGRFFTQDDYVEAVFLYQGGYNYIVDDATKAALIAGNVGVTSANFSQAPGTFGYGGFGSGGFGGP